MPLSCVCTLFPLWLVLPALVRLDFEQRGFLEDIDQGDELLLAQLIVINPQLFAEQAGLALLCAALVTHGGFQLLPRGVGGIDRIRCR